MGYLGPLTSASYSSTMSHQTPPPPPGQRIGDVYTGDMPNTTALVAPRSSTPQAVTMDHYHHPKKGVETAGADVVEAADVLLCDLGNKAMVVEDLENALRLWTKPAVLIAGRNSLDGLPSNVPETILYLDLSWNRLAALEGFAALPNLRELDLSHNGVQDMLGLVGNTDLRVLRIAHNRVRRIEGLQQLKRLEEADLSHNLLKTTADVRALSLNSSLRRLRMEGNPFCTTGVRYGTYEVAVQHLLPGMALLDGKPQSSLLSVSLPPPPTRVSAATAANRGPRGCSPHVTSSARDAQAVNNVSCDLSVTRGWRDSAVARAGNTQSLVPAHDKQKRAGNTAVGGQAGGIARVGMPTGGGGPAMAPGSYVELFVVAQRKKQGLITTMDTAQASPAAGASTSRGTSRGVYTVHDRHAVRGKETATPAGFHGHTPGDDRRRVAAAVGSEEGRADVDGRVGARAAHIVGGGRDSAAHSAAPVSLPLKRGISRAERAAARRLAWSQARQEGAVGTGAAKCQGKEISPAGALASRVASRATLHVAGDDGGKRRVLRSRSPDHNKPTARERSIGRRSQGGAAAQALQLSASQALVADRRSRRTSGITAGAGVAFDRNGSGGGSSSGMACGITGPPQNPQGHRRQAGMRSRARDGDTKPGAKRLMNCSSRQVVGAALSESARGLRGRRARGGAAHSSVAGSGTDNKKQHKKSAPPIGGGGGEDTYRYKTTLGQRSRRGPRPVAPHTSPWTPREDAKPWRDGEGSDGRHGRDSHRGAADAGDGVEDDLSGSRYFAPTEMTSTTIRREESLSNRGGGGRGGGGGRVTTKRKGNVGHYQHHHHHHHHGGEDRRFEQNGGGEDSSADLERFGDSGGSGGGRVSRARPYVSPLSPAGILQRAFSTRSAGSLPATSTAEKNRTTAASSRPRLTSTTPNDSQEDTYLEFDRDGRGRRSGPVVDPADRWKARPAGVWKGSDSPDPAQVFYRDQPYYEEREEEHEEEEEEESRRRGTLWEDQPPHGQLPYPVPYASPIVRKGPTRDDDDGGSEGYHHQRPLIPLPSELHLSEEISPRYSEGAGTRSTGDSSSGGGRGGRGGSGGSGGSARGDGDGNGRRSIRDHGGGRVGQTSTRGEQQRRHQQRVPKRSWTGAPTASKVRTPPSPRRIPPSPREEARARRWKSPGNESPPLVDNAAEEVAMGSEPRSARLVRRGVADLNDQGEWEEDDQRRLSYRDVQMADRSQPPDRVTQIYANAPIANGNDQPVAFGRAEVHHRHVVADDLVTFEAERSGSTLHGDGLGRGRHDRYAHSCSVDDNEETLSQKELLARAGIALEEVRGARAGDDGVDTCSTRQVAARLGDGPPGEGRGKGSQGTSGRAGNDAAVEGFHNEVVDMLASMVGGAATAVFSTDT